MPANQGQPAADPAIAAPASPYGLRLHDDRRTQHQRVTYVPTHHDVELCVTVKVRKR